KLIDVTSGDTATLLDNNLALVILDIEDCDLTAQALRHQLQAQVLALHMENVGGVERVQHFLGGVTERAQQYRGRQLAATVDAHEYAILRIEFEIQPRPAVRNDARGVKQFAGAVRLATVVVKEHARRTVQLGN